MPGGEKDKTADYPVDKDGNKLKPCCACPETKRPRDECIMEKVRIKQVLISSCDLESSVCQKSIQLYLVVLILIQGSQLI